VSAGRHHTGGADVSLTAYDVIPYVARAVPPSHPLRLASLSTLYGGPRPPTHGYRVLEIGCANGANLLPLAFYDREVQAVGVDASTVQIDAARAGASGLGLDNVRFELGDLRSFDAAGDLDGTFDYVIAHGVLSWVPTDARQALLALCARALAPHGVAYVSYNTFPGWKLRGTVRDLLLQQVADIPDLRARAERAFALARENLDLLELAAGHPYMGLLKIELKLIERLELEAVAHDYLEATNVPFYFHEVAAHASACGLAHVTDARFSPSGLMEIEGARDDLAEDDFTGVALEQMIDLLTFRQLRASILCRASALGAPPALAEVGDLTLRSRLALPPGQVDLTDGVPLEVEDPYGRHLSFGAPLLKALLQVLDRAPGGWLALAAARRQAEALLDPPCDAGESRELPALLRLLDARACSS